MVKKEAKRVVIIAENYRIEGYMYLIPGARIVDELNKNTQFIPLTDCVIYDKDTSLEVDRVEFMVLNKNSITMIFPPHEV
ncbi:MAG: hypothetical protein RMJ51_00545 [Candidatus Calescibacterium sp.]|nr:hypothetical protein [Candidatus Calescibacterium sp.]MCX7972681.1 hypothetical protein [bacterium]MDW8194722.1 hypothetical protein [Candidatus Calescibacterium sp.]